MSSNKINNYHSRRADENAAAVPLFALVKWPRIPLVSGPRIRKAAQILGIHPSTVFIAG
jgi:hypothetical protein